MNVAVFIRESMVVLITSLVVGIGASYIATAVHLAKLEERSIYVDKQIEILEGVLGSLQVMQVELSRRGEWMRWVTAELEDINELPSLELDIAVLEKRIEMLEDKNKEGG